MVSNARAGGRHPVLACQEAEVGAVWVHDAGPQSRRLRHGIYLDMVESSGEDQDGIVGEGGDAVAVARIVTRAPLPAAYLTAWPRPRPTPLPRSPPGVGRKPGSRRTRPVVVGMVRGDHAALDAGTEVGQDRFQLQKVIGDQCRVRRVVVSSFRHGEIDHWLLLPNRCRQVLPGPSVRNTVGLVCDRGRRVWKEAGLPAAGRFGARAGEGDFTRPTPRS